MQRRILSVVTPQKEKGNRTLSRQILIERDGKPDARVECEDGDKLTFGPWSPSREERGYGSKPTGTLRIYRGSKENCIFVMSGVTAYRDVSVNFEEKIAVEEGAKLWKSDKSGYKREETVKREERWETPELLGPGIEADEADEPVVSRSKSKRK